MLDLFAKNTGLKTRAGHHRRDAATAVRTSSRSARFERVPTADRQALSLRASRAPALRGFLGGLSIIVTQFLSRVLETIPVTRPAIHPKPERRAAVRTQTARRGERCRIRRALRDTVEVSQCR